MDDRFERVKKILKYALPILVVIIIILIIVSNKRGFNDIEKSMVAFMNSPTHRKNIMNPNLVYIGIGIAPINGTYYYAQEFRA